MPDTGPSPPHDMGRQCSDDFDDHTDDRLPPMSYHYKIQYSKGIEMSESTITVKGQTTVPQPVRDSMHAEAGTKLTWSVMPDGTAIVRAKTKSILDLAGTLKAPKGKRVRVEDMSPWR